MKLTQAHRNLHINERIEIGHGPSSITAPRVPVYACPVAPARTDGMDKLGIGTATRIPEYSHARTIFSFGPARQFSDRRLDDGGFTGTHDDVLEQATTRAITQLEDLTGVEISKDFAESAGAATFEIKVAQPADTVQSLDEDESYTLVIRPGYIDLERTDRSGRDARLANPAAIGAEPAKRLYFARCQHLRHATISLAWSHDRLRTPL